MAFVRAKRISGSEYGYLVENSWTENGPRQKVGKYLGRLYRPSKAKSEGLANFVGTMVEQHIKSSDFKKIAADLINLELHNHEVKSNDFVVDFENFSVKNNSGKNIVVALNEGFLCEHTLKQLLEYDAGKDYSGYLLADLITAAGIVPEQDVFIELYGKFKAKQEAAAARKFDFYY